MTCGIYKIQNKINGKIYVGQSSNIEQRWKVHKTLIKNKNIQNKEEKQLTKIELAYLKYNIEDFNFEIIEECSQEELNEREKYWIHYYDSYYNGYNSTLGGQQGKCQSSTRLTLKQVNEIKTLLKENNLSFKEIANIYNIRYINVSYINTGYFWYDEKDTYPIRIPKERNLIKKNGITLYVKNICPICGKTLTSNKTKMCRECATKKYREEKIISKEELKNNLRLHTFKELTEIYLKSDSYFRYWAKYYNLPTKKKIIDNMAQEEWDKL